MSDRRLFGLFSGTHLIIALVAALLAPSALYATVTFSNVALVNPTTGVPAAVDSVGRLTVVDPYAFYRNNPQNQIDFYTEGPGSRSETGTGSGCSSNQWTIPSGKAFIMTAMSGYEVNANSNFYNSSVNIWTGVGCSSHRLTAHSSTITTYLAPTPIAVEYGVGIPIPAGSVIGVDYANNFGYTWIHGYLVPAALVSSSQYVGP